MQYNGRCLELSTVNFSWVHTSDGTCISVENVLFPGWGGFHCFGIRHSARSCGRRHLAVFCAADGRQPAEKLPEKPMRRKATTWGLFPSPDLAPIQCYILLNLSPAMECHTDTGMAAYPIGHHEATLARNGQRLASIPSPLTILQN